MGFSLLKAGRNTSRQKGGDMPKGLAEKLAQAQGRGETLAEAMARVKEAAPLKDYCESHLEKRGRDSYVCPFCGSGNGPNRSAAFTVTGQRFKCFSASCGRSGDVFDLAGVLGNTEDKAEQLEAVARWAGVDGWDRAAGVRDRGAGYGWDDTVTVQDEPPTPAQAPEPTRTAQSAEPPANGRAKAADSHAEGRARHAAYVEEMRANIGMAEAVEYLASRGIDLETAQAWGLGYDPAPTHGWQDVNGAWHSSGRIVIPWAGAPWYHIDRACDDRAKNLKYDKPSSEEVGAQPLWNPAALEAPAFFVCEGALDALAIQACGYEAVALGNAGGASLVAAMNGTAQAGTALLMLDFDQPKPDGRRAGQEGQEKLSADMEAAGIDHISLDTEALGAKDAAELFAADRQRLKATLDAWHAQGMAERERRKEERYAAALKRLHVVDAATIADNICTMANPVIPIPTGFAKLDNALGDGLQPKNVYVLGGTPSMGKTTAALQISDQIAASGRAHCLFVSVEQRAPELIAKSLSRVLATRPDAEGRTHYATAQDLTVYARRMAWNEDVSNLFALAEAQAYYRDVIAPRSHFMEGQQQPTVKDVRTIAETIADRNGEPPLITIDYLQLLSPPKGLERADEKSVLKANMVALRQMAGTLNTPVIVLAALSRDGGLKAMEIDSFRDSSNIEFSADVLLGLQLRNFRKRLDSVDEKKRRYLAATWIAEEKQKRTRSLEFVILKNRGGDLYDGEDGGIPVWFDAPLNAFSEVGWAL